MVRCHGGTNPRDLTGPRVAPVATSAHRERPMAKRLAMIAHCSLWTGVLLASMAAPVAGQARVQLSAGYGTVSAPRVLVAFGSLFQDALSFGGYRARNSRSTGVHALGVGLARGNTTYDLTGSFETITSDVLLNDGNDVRDGTQRVTSNALLLGATRRYGSEGDAARFFSGIALGPAFHSTRVDVSAFPRSDSHHTTLAYQVDLLGLSLGGRLAGWGVVGVGYLGTFRAGATYRF